MSRTNTAIAKSLLKGNISNGFHIEKREGRQFLVYRRKSPGSGTDVALPRNPKHVLSAVSALVGASR